MATRDAPGMGGSNWKTSEPFGTSGSTGDDDGPGTAGADPHGSHHHAGQQAGEIGRRALGAVQERIRSAFDQQTNRAADQLAGVASALNRAARDISRENDGPVIHYAEQAAGRMQAVADTLRHSSLDDMVGEVEGFARRQPELFLGGVFAAGFLFARFLKSSADRRAISRPYTASSSDVGRYTGTGPVGMSTPATGTPVTGGPVMGTPDTGGGPDSDSMAGRSAGMGSMSSAGTRPRTGTPLYAAPASPSGTRTGPSGTGSGVPS